MDLLVKLNVLDRISSSYRSLEQQARTTAAFEVKDLNYFSTTAVMLVLSCYIDDFKSVIWG